VASTTIAPGCPSAKRVYQSRTSLVTNPSSVARHGTIAGTQVRSASTRRPAASGENSSDAAASSAVGLPAAEGRSLIRSGGCHIPKFAARSSQLAARLREQLLRNHEPLDLRCSLVNPRGAHLAIEPLDDRPVLHAETAVDLHGAVDDPLSRFRREEL